MQKQTNYTPGATLSRGMRYAIVKAVSPMISDFQLVIFRLSKTSRHGPAKKDRKRKETRLMRFKLKRREIAQDLD